jgi:hypothetical protein
LEVGWRLGGGSVIPALNVTLAEIRMHPITSLPQAVDLAQLVEVEAQWENLPSTPTQNSQDLATKQRAYAAFSSRRADYNEQHKGYESRVSVNSPARLRVWLCEMRDLFAQAKSDPRCPCPKHLVEKARRYACRIASRLKVKSPLVTPPATVQLAITELEKLLAWNEVAELSGGSPAMTPESGT